MHCRRRPRDLSLVRCRPPSGVTGSLKPSTFQRPPRAPARPLWGTYNRHRILIRQKKARKVEKKEEEKSVAFLHVPLLRPSKTRVGYHKIIRLIRFARASETDRISNFSAGRLKILRTCGTLPTLITCLKMRQCLYES